ncbi:MAG: hypothetical protein AJITA_00469 [Acetilactobacillus jinshanensis]
MAPYFVHYFNNYKNAYNYIFYPTFATPTEQRLIKAHQLDLVIYTDGGQRNSNDGAWAYSINGSKQQIESNSRYFNTKNNNYCELEAVIQVLKRLINLHWYDKRIRIDTDSVSVKSIIHNVRHGISIQSIARNTEWKIGQISVLKEYLQRFTHLHIRQIKGHSGILGNQLVHQLCSKAMCFHYPNSYDPFKINPKDLITTAIIPTRGLNVLNYNPKTQILVTVGVSEGIHSTLTPS